jgi:uncharacterized membrane protein
MSKTRLEAFSDGVIAIIITIMVLELKVPEHSPHFADLRPLLPIVLSYLLSFIYVGIYWNNHHHLLHATRRVTGGIMWANLHLLFWLSLIPFVTGWMGENEFAPAPMALYGGVLFCCGCAYLILQRVILRTHSDDSVLAVVIGKNFKGRISALLYLVATGASFFSPWVAGAIYVLVAAMWLIPDRRIERALATTNTHES